MALSDKTKKKLQEEKDGFLSKKNALQGEMQQLKDDRDAIIVQRDVINTRIAEIDGDLLL